MSIKSRNIKHIRKKIFIFFLIFLVSYLFVWYRTHVVFSTKSWILYPENRRFMIVDLLKNHNLIGLTKEQITALLGSQMIKEDRAYDRVFPLNKKSYSKDKYLLYYIEDDFFSPFYEKWMIIEFNENQISVKIDYDYLKN